MALTAQLTDQLDWHRHNALRPRLDGLTDDEYFWEPVPDCWTLHRDGTIDFAHPAPAPAPFTTIAWRLAHVIVGVLAMRNHSHFGGPPATTRPGRTPPMRPPHSPSSTTPTGTGTTGCDASANRIWPPRWARPRDRGPTVRCWT